MQGSQKAANSWNLEPCLICLFFSVFPMSDENSPVNALQLGNRKKQYDHHSSLVAHGWWLSHASNPLVHHGHYFGRTVHAMWNVQALVMNNLLRMADGVEVAEELLTPEFVWSFLLLSSGMTCPSAIQSQKGVPSVSKALVNCTPIHWPPHSHVWRRVHDDGRFSMSIAPTHYKSCLTFSRFRRVYLVQGQMMPRVKKVLSSTG